MHGKRGGVRRFLLAHTDNTLMLFHATRALRRFLARRLGSSSGREVFECPMDDVQKSWAYMAKSQELRRSNRRRGEISVTQQVLHLFISQKVRLRRSGSAMHRSSGQCVKVPVTMLALRRSFTSQRVLCRDEVLLALRLQKTGGKLNPSPWRALPSRARAQQGSRATARQQSF
ncbi:hypothetical protein NDU88_006003 [Pleurodeles waltl]|uniref:Uncharacterized protein n=1 Tax=Pleurodeles waltl TaxID=8319 RepID=A0AAV7WD48_PLEWA|nr:hypothetical protein NDU88_006003 [Pleurodeles waltl]